MGGNSSVPDGCWLADVNCRCNQGVDSPFSNWTETDTWGRSMAVVTRAYGCMGKSMFTLSDLTPMLDNAYYSYVWRNIRVPHAAAHMWCGGSMMTQAPPSDPVCTNIDIVMVSLIDSLIGWLIVILFGSFICRLSIRAMDYQSKADRHVLSQ
jgi:hypothetical protein